MASIDAQQQSVIVDQPESEGVSPQTVTAPAAPTEPAPSKQGQWMPAPTIVVANCPPGLEYLTQIDQILVHQQIELVEILSGFETTNKYVVKNSLGQKIFFAAEQSSCCQRFWCSNIRDFQMAIVDNFGNEVIHLNRPLACQSFCCPCWLQKLEVSAPPGNVIGTIEQNWSLYPVFDVKDASGETILKIKGPLFTISCCGDVVFDIFSRDGETKVGKISKQWGGFLMEASSDADMFGINFPMDLDVKMKCVMLGACFLIDFMYFESTQQGSQQHHNNLLTNNLN